LRAQFLGHLNGGRILRGNGDSGSGLHADGCPAAVRVLGLVPTGRFEPGIVELTGIEIGTENGALRGLPGAIRDDRVAGSILVFNFELCEQARRGRAKVVAHQLPAEGAPVPALAERCADRVPALRQKARYVVSLILDTLAIVGPIRRENVLANALAVDVKTVAAERSHVNARPRDGLR